MTDANSTADALEDIANWIIENFEPEHKLSAQMYGNAAAYREAAALIREQRTTILHQTGRIAALEMMLKRPTAAQSLEPVPPAPLCLETSPWGARIVPPGKKPQPGPFARFWRWLSGKGGVA